MDVRVASNGVSRRAGAPARDGSENGGADRWGDRRSAPLARSQRLVRETPLGPPRRSACARRASPARIRIGRRNSLGSRSHESSNLRDRSRCDAGRGNHRALSCASRRVGSRDGCAVGATGLGYRATPAAPTAIASHRLGVFRGRARRPSLGGGQASAQSPFSYLNESRTFAR